MPLHTRQGLREQPKPLLVRIQLLRIAEGFGDQAPGGDEDVVENCGDDKLDAVDLSQQLHQSGNAHGLLVDEVEGCLEPKTGQDIVTGLDNVLVLE